MSWLWAVFTVLAAGGQVLRNAQQKELTSSLGTVGATHVHHELAAHGTRETHAAGERNQLLVERAGEGDDSVGHRRLRNTPTTLPMTCT